VSTSEEAKPNKSARKLENTKRILAPLIYGGTSVLDLGCGDGEIARWATERGALVTAIDKRPVALPPPIQFIHGNVCKLQLRLKYDIIIASQVIEHVDDSRLIEVIKAHSYPNTTIYISTHNSFSLQYALVAPIHWLIHRKPYLGMDREHVRMYSYRSLDKALRQHGFKIFHRFGEYHIPYRLLRWLIPIRFLERLPLHLTRWGHLWPLNRTGWHISVLAVRWRIPEGNTGE
jgi:SAM-dependent methyltransferase